MARHNLSVSDTVFEELQKYAEGFQSPDTVLRKVLGLPPRSYKGRIDPVIPLQVLKTDADIEELAIELAVELEGRLGPEGSFWDQLENRVISNFGDELLAIPEGNVLDEAENEKRFNHYNDMMTLSGQAVLELLSEQLMSAYKMPGGGEDDGGDEETPEKSRRKGHKGYLEWQGR